MPAKNICIHLKDKKIHTVEINLKSPLEMRALYIFLQLISRKEFKAIQHGMCTFENLPGLGSYTKSDIHQNPIEDIYNLLNNHTIDHHLSETEVTTIILACKKAIHVYCQKLLDLLTCDLLNTKSDMKLPMNLLIKATSKGRPLSKDEFMGDSLLQRFNFIGQQKKESMFALYIQHQDLLAQFTPIDYTNGINIPGLIESLKQLSDRIMTDEYIGNDEVRINGLDIQLHETHIRPSLWGSYASAAVGTSITAARSIYDIAGKPLATIGSGSTVATVAGSNALGLAALLTTVLTNHHATRYKEQRDTRNMHEAVKQLADIFPEYRRLLEEKGYRYTDSDIEIINDDASTINHASDKSNCQAAASTTTEARTTNTQPSPACQTPHYQY